MDGDVRRLISLALRRQRPGSGSALALLRERTARMRFPDLGPVLESIPWAVVGAVATRLYMPERATRDLDIVVRRRDAGEVRRRLTQAGFRYRGDLAVGSSSWLSPEGVEVDVLEMDEPWLPRALAEARRNRDPQGLPVLPLPYLLLMKLRAGRVQDLADVTRMLGQAGEETLEAVRRLFARYAPSDLEDLESLVRLGKMETEPEPPPKGEGDEG
jgi:hypothetical protein